MQTIDHQVFEACGHWLAAGQQVWLCTIVRTVGSSPRPVGSLLACNADREQVGSLSGGCVEDDLLERIRAGELALSRPQIIEYGVTPEENERLGLPCGGRLQVLVEQLSGKPEVQAQMETLLAALEQRQCQLRHVDLQTGESRLEPVANFQTLQMSEAQVSQCFGPRMWMLLVGAGQLAQALSELALAMDYEVLVTDPRAELLSRWPGPAVQLVGGMPDDAVREYATDRHSIIITLTHDPRIDDMALMEALTTEAWYVGALGSARTTEKRLTRLRALDLSEAQIDKLHAPVGLPIGSKTPVEITIAIMAQLTQLRRQS
ncbi:MAG: XdhC family protein [Gammaproteobacteria bacterium]|nr:XdhC family protein [Gammaproteobacteria bacterium]